MTVEILNSAMNHLVEGFRFYEQQERGLGSDFLDSLFAETDLLAYRGGIHARRYGFHRCVSDRYPFAIYYALQGNHVKVHAVLDCRRSPAWIHRRLRDT